LDERGTRRASPSRRRFVAIAQELLEAIERADFRPHDRLPPDRELAAQKGVSRATIREALLALELVGVLEIRHGSGAYVVDPNEIRAGDEPLRPSTAALFEARAAVEPKVAELCAVRITPAALKDLSLAVSQARAAIRDGAPYAVFAELQLSFHTQLAAACGSPVLADIAKRLVSADEHPLWALVNQHALRTRSQRLGQIAEHAAVLKHIKAGDRQAASAAMHTHVIDLGCVLLGEGSTA
jgi:DNA-binding FadR family transcriptional regulator